MNEGECLVASAARACVRESIAALTVEQFEAALAQYGQASETEHIHDWRAWLAVRIEALANAEADDRFPRCEDEDDALVLANQYVWANSMFSQTGLLTA